MTVRTRFAPSPTGYLHVGGARTALFSWLYARKHGGTFVLRIEDTDLERSTKASVDAILDGMNWLGLDYEEGPFYQTERFDRYYEVIDQLMDNGHAYRCNCSKDRLDELRETQMANKMKPRYDGHCRDKEVDQNQPHVIRFKNPQEGAVVIDDMVKGRVMVENSELDDLIIRRTDGSPTYNLTVVVDDTDMQITHVIRGDDHLNNTPRQINMMNALDLEIPKFAHLPMILGNDGSRLSKRHGAVSVLQYQEEGFLPEALLNYLVRLGWSHGDQELFSIDEMIALFDIAEVNNSAASFDTDKLRWINQQTIQNASTEVLIDQIKKFNDRKTNDERSIVLSNNEGTDVSQVFLESQKDRATTLLDVLAESENILAGKWMPEYDQKAAKKNLRPVAKEPLEKIYKKLADQNDWTREALHQCVIDVAEALEVGMGKVGQPLRVALVGGSSSPSIDVTLEMTGKKATLQRIEQALKFIDDRIENG